MDIWVHSQLSAKKFGGQAADYVAIHEFVDHSKLFFFHFKHRCVLHHTFGIELCIRRFGTIIENSAGDAVLVRDITAEHLKEDLSKRVPTLTDWFADNETLFDALGYIVPTIADEKVNAFVQAPLLRTGIKSSLVITCSDFGVYLVETFFGLEAAQELRTQLPAKQTIKTFLTAFQLTQPWQYTPDMEQLKLLHEV